ncbi:MAG: phage tail family protein [Clostridia bacterium]|nr:phage tail family protein [Clostridia bacterium]
MPEILYIELIKGDNRIIAGGREFGQDFNLVSAAGLDSPDYSVSIQSSGSNDGGYIASAKLDKRPIKLVFDVEREIEGQIERVRGLCEPHDDITIIVHRGNTIRSAIGRVEGFRVSQETIYHEARITISILCPFPYFKGEPASKNNVERIPAIKFPLSVPPTGLAAGYLLLAANLRIENSGNTNAGIVAKLVFTGPVTNPKIINLVTGEYIRLINAFEAGDELIISTATKNKYVKCNGTNCIHKVDRSSVFFSLIPGENVIGYNADSGYSNLSIYVSCTPLFLGV